MGSRVALGFPARLWPDSGKQQNGGEIGFCDCFEPNEIIRIAVRGMAGDGRAARSDF
jgi:hypothetical protein